MPRFLVGSTFLRNGADKNRLERPGDLAVANDNRTLRGQLEASVELLAREAAARDQLLLDDAL